ncbi:MAG TPA: hypothetical protein VJM11_02100, partial [Nevskiaceae bacterium]|nr:hypothetical protein [Nevskiaceae bacterium]
MPYVLDTAANGVTFKGITLVDSANFGQSNRLVAKAANVGAPSIVVAGDIDDTGLHNVRPHTLVWAQENRWKRAPLRQGLEPTPETVSSEPAANTACDHEVIYRDFS